MDNVPVSQVTMFSATLMRELAYLKLAAVTADMLMRERARSTVLQIKHHTNMDDVAIPEEYCSDRA
jgi:hypothetical protein